MLWTRTEEKAEQLRRTRRNPRLPDVPLPETLRVSPEYSCVSGCPLVVIACPSFPMRRVCEGIAPYLEADAVLVSVTKGIEEGTLLRMSQVIPAGDRA